MLARVVSSLLSFIQTTIWSSGLTSNCCALGLGAAWRLHEIGHDNWICFEENPTVGGLARTITDERGFLWDIGMF